MTAWAKPFRGSRIGGPREMPQPLSVDKEKKKEKTRKGKREGKPRQRRRRVRWSKPPFMGLGFRFFLRFLPSSCAFISGCHCFVLLRGRLSRGLCPAHRLGNLEVMLPLLSKTARAKQENERSFLPSFMFSIPGAKAVRVHCCLSAQRRRRRRKVYPSPQMWVLSLSASRD